MTRYSIERRTGKYAKGNRFLDMDLTYMRKSNWILL